MKRQFCSFWMGKLLYGMPVEEVQEVIREQEITRVPLAESRVRGLINLRGKIVTAIDLRADLGVTEEKVDGQRMNVVVSNEDNTVSFLVDSIGDVLDVDEEMFEPVPDSIKSGSEGFVIGVYKLQDGLLHALDAGRCVQVEDGSGK